MNLEGEEDWAAYMAARTASARIGLGFLAEDFERRGGYGEETAEPGVHSRTLQVVRMDALGAQRHNPWREDLAERGRGRRSDESG